MIVTLQCTSGNDDARETASESAFSASGSTIAIDSNAIDDNRSLAGFRFTNVPVSNPAAIRAAWLQLLVDSDGDANFNIAANLNVNPDNFATDPHVVDRPLTVGAGAWVESLVAGWRTSPDIRPVIQEVLSEPGWAAGNALVLILVGNNDFPESLVVAAYESGAANAAKLILDIEPATALICGRRTSKRPIFQR
jgi:hypothetical protein